MEATDKSSREKTIMEHVPNHIVKFIKKNGRLYTPAITPKDITRGAIGECFDTSAANALEEKYIYVEGIALRPGTENEWILHAWLTDGKMAYDPTWKADFQGQEIPVPTTYLGIPMAIKDVAKFMLETRYASIFANAFRNPKLAEIACPGIPTKKP